LQSAIRRHLTSESNLQGMLNELGFPDVSAMELEVLSEKALPQGHIDILLKRRVPLGSDMKIPIEVKTKKAQPKDLTQLCGYMTELRGECLVGVLVAQDFHRQVIASAKDLAVALVRYSLAETLGDPMTFEELKEGLRLTSIGK